MSSQRKAVAVLGLGSMGAALAHTFLNEGFEVHAWNRTRERKGVIDVIGAGGKAADSPKVAIQNAPVIIICVMNYDAIYIMFQGLPKEELVDKTIVNLTNGAPKEARAMSEWAKQRNVSTYFDGGIMARPPVVSTKEAFVFYSGEAKTKLDEIEDYIKPLGRIEYVGENPGAAAVYDLALLSGMYGMLGGAMTAIALLSKTASSDHKPSSVVETSLIPWIQALLPSLTSIAQRIESQDFGAHGHPNGMRYSSLSNLLQACADGGVESGALAFLTEAVGSSVREGYGDMGFAHVARKFMKTDDPL